MLSMAFLSTLPARGATHTLSPERVILLVFLSTLPARGATLQSVAYTPIQNNFYPRSPRGERLYLFHRFPGHQLISIHAPREGSDSLSSSSQISAPNFYPRSPRGERRSTLQRTSASWTFLSTLPARGATAYSRYCPAYQGISIHAPREGSDPMDDIGQSQKRISIHAPREGSD